MNSPTSSLFDIYFSSVYGERWSQIQKFLRTPEKQVLRVNGFVKNHNFENLEPCEFLSNCYWRPESYTLAKNTEGLYPFYIMDPASILVANALAVQKGEQVLDMCAAPGGKSLILAEQAPEVLIANEISDSRRDRLMRVFHEYIPKENRLFVHVKGLDGNQYGLRSVEVFDRILADVPCSGERHLIDNPSEFALWTEKRTKNLAIRQYSLLSSAWLACKIGGRIVYSTCSVSPVENDAVVKKLIKKRGVETTRLPEYDDLNFLEKTEFGYQVLPDRCGFGPMYFSVIQKV